MALSNFASEETLRKRTSAGNLLPDLTMRMSPGTMFSAMSSTWLPSRITMQFSGNIVLMEFITREEDQSCHMLKAAWMKKTASSTMASAKLATAGGLPRGFHAMKTRMEATRRTVPKPLKKYPRMRFVWFVGAGEGAFLP